MSKYWESQIVREERAERGVCVYTLLSESRAWVWGQGPLRDRHPTRCVLGGWLTTIPGAVMHCDYSTRYCTSFVIILPGAVIYSTRCGASFVTVLPGAFFHMWHSTRYGTLFVSTLPGAVLYLCLLSTLPGAVLHLWLFYPVWSHRPGIVVIMTSAPGRVVTNAHRV